MKRKRRTASNSPDLPFSKQKHSGKKQDVLTAEEYRNQHRGKEKDLQEAAEELCGIYGWLRLGTIRDEDKIPLNCPGVFWHVPKKAYQQSYVAPEIGRNLANKPDLMLWRRDRACIGIELKRKTGRRSIGQRKLAEFMPVHLCKSVEHADRIIRDFAKEVMIGSNEEESE